MDDEWFELLADDVRREVLFGLLGDGSRDPVVTVPDGVDAGDRDPRRVALSLWHTDLPKLADAGVVDWDREAGEVTRGPDFDAIRPLLEAVEPVVDSGSRTV